MVPALNALYALVVAAVPSSVTVLLGPQPVTPGATGDVVLIGVDDPASNGPALAIEGEQEFVLVGNTRKETFTIYSTYVAWSGDQDIPGCLSRADANLGLVENALRTNGVGGGMSLNGALYGVGNNTMGYCGMGISKVSLVSDDTGTAVHMQFVVACNAQI